MWTAIKYIFGYKSNCGHWDCWLLDSRDTAGLIDMLQEHQKRLGNRPQVKFIGNPRKD
jgi:hypothetical protein